jgi:hypothetical protein
MNDQEFREHYKPVHIVASYQEANTLQEKVIYALANIGEGSAEEVVLKMEELDPEAPNKEVIGVTHRILTELHSSGLIAGREERGSIIYNLHKITEPNSGAVDPDLLAPGLD